MVDRHDAATGSAEPRLRLAIVDDHELLLDSMAGWIEVNAPDFKVVLAVSSWQALVRSREFPTDVVFLDVQLRESISIEARIRTCRAAGASVIALSGLDTPEARDRSARAGALAFLSKSLSMAEVMRQVREVLGLERNTVAEVRWTSRGAAAAPVVSPSSPRLSAGERQALALYASGLSVQEVASEMNVQYETAKTYLRRIRQKYTKLGRSAGRRAELIMRAAEDGFLG